MSRLAALKEFTFMRALKDAGFVVPEPIAHNRHTVVMELIDAFPLRQIKEVPDPSGLYAELVEMVLRLAGVGLIHGDFNEFNILVKEDAAPRGPDEPMEATADDDTGVIQRIKLTPYLIDFPQMVSIDHANAEMYFDRDVNCIKRFFERRFHFTSDEPGPFFADARERTEGNLTRRLDVEAEASGFSKKMAKELEKYMKEVGVDGDRDEPKDNDENGDQTSETDEEKLDDNQSIESASELNAQLAT